MHYSSVPGTSFFFPCCRDQQLQEEDGPREGSVVLFRLHHLETYVLSVGITYYLSFVEFVKSDQAD